MLDDVLQSVDASIRVAFAEFLLTEFKRLAGYHHSA